MNINWKLMLYSRKSQKHLIKVLFLKIQPKSFSNVLLQSSIEPQENKSKCELPAMLKQLPHNRCCKNTQLNNCFNIVKLKMNSSRKLNIRRNKYYRQIGLISLRTSMAERITGIIADGDDMSRNWLAINQLIKKHFNK